MFRKLTYREYLQFMSLYKIELYSAVAVHVAFEQYLEKEWRRIRSVLLINQEVFIQYKKNYYVRRDGHLYAILDNRWRGRMYFTSYPKSNKYKKYAMSEVFWLKVGNFDDV